MLGELLTRQQAAEFLKMSVMSLDRLRQQGKLKYRRLGNQIRFLATDLEDFVISSIDGGWQPQTRNRV